MAATAITADQVKQLRDRTGAGMMECKAALNEANANMEEAITILRKRGLAQAAKRAGRTTGQGLIGSYIHLGGKIGEAVVAGRSMRESRIAEEESARAQEAAEADAAARLRSAVRPQRREAAPTAAGA